MPASLIRILVAVALFVTLAPAPTAAQGGAPSLRLTLRPGGSAGDPDRIDVTMRLSGIVVPAGSRFLEVALVVGNMLATKYEDGEVVATDNAGALPLLMGADTSSENRYGPQRVFVATRASAGDIIVRYTASIPSGPSQRFVPPLDLRRQSGGISGAGYGFLILPADDRSYLITVSWDLNSLPAVTRAASSLGDGTVSLFGPVDRLRAAYYMVGPLNRYPQTAGKFGFNAFWLGTPAFNAPSVMEWTYKAHGALQSFFHDAQSPPYFVFARKGSAPTSGGAAIGNSFMVGFGTDSEPDASIRFLLTHEMVHTWIGGLTGSEEGAQWYSEGLAEYYKLRIPLLAGLIGAEAFAEELAETTQFYYANPKNRLTNDRIAAGFWNDGYVQRLPYDRGLMYFADLDAKVRAASGGSRSLDDLVLGMIESRKRGTGYDMDAWVRTITEAVGTSAQTDLTAMLKGELIVPPANAFGPCFTRTEAKSRVAGRAVVSYKWVRVPAVPAEQCALPSSKR